MLGTHRHSRGNVFRDSRARANAVVDPPHATGTFTPSITRATTCTCTNGSSPLAYACSLPLVAHDVHHEPALQHRVLDDPHFLVFGVLHVGERYQANACVASVAPPCPRTPLSYHLLGLHSTGSCSLRQPAPPEVVGSFESYSPPDTPSPFPSRRLRRRTDDT